MGNSKLYMILIAQTEAIVRDIQDGRRISQQVIAEMCMIPDDAIPDDIARLAKMAFEYVDYAYGSYMHHETNCPEWFKVEWISADW